MTTSDLIKEVDNETVAIIREHLANGQLTDERAKEIASFVLHELQPSMSLAEMYTAISRFDDHYPELRKVVIVIAEKYDSNIKADALTQLHTLLQKQDYSAALNVLDSALKTEDKLGSIFNTSAPKVTTSQTPLTNPERILNEIIKDNK